MDQIILEAIPELIATLVGIFIGSMAAFAADRRSVSHARRKRKHLTLRNLLDELEENYSSLGAVLPAYRDTEYGKSVYISTIAWETAVSSADLPDLIGAELADEIENQYALLMRLRYYVNLLTQLWFAPRDIEGYENIREGFRRKILDGMQVIINHHSVIREKILEEDPNIVASRGDRTYVPSM